MWVWQWLCSKQTKHSNQLKTVFFEIVQIQSGFLLKGDGTTHPKRFLFPFFLQFSRPDTEHTLGGLWGQKMGEEKAQLSSVEMLFSPWAIHFFLKRDMMLDFFCQSHTTRESIKEGMYFKGDYHFLFNDQQHRLSFSFFIY